MRNYNNLDELEHEEDQRIGKVAAGIYLLLLLIVLFFPWFTTTYPLPEPGGLMASFGNVEVAGGSEDFVQEEPQEQPEEQPEQPVEEPIEEPIEDPIEEDVETSEIEAPAVVAEDPKPKPEVQPESKPTPSKPKPKVNQNALFPGSGGSGKGTGQGSGIQGTPDGKSELGGTGNGTQGKGNGQGLGQRRILSKCSDYDGNRANWSEKASIIVDVCIDSRGKVSTARINRRKSKTNDSNLLELALECAKQYRYEKAPGQPDACGEITIYLKLN